MAMKNLDKYEKLIWEQSNKINIPKPSKIEDSWNNLCQKINLNETSKRTIPIKIFNILKANLSTNNKIINYKYILSYSLSFIFICFFSIYFYSSRFNIYDIPKKTIILPDKSIITLNTSSSIKYKKKFLINREIFLKGEAFFNVQKNEKPFTIITDYGIIKVLGTSFNVRSRADGFEIGVNEGIVEVSNKKSSFLIKQDQMIITKNEIINKNQIINKPYKDYPDWLNNKLYFNNTSILEVCGELERTFKIKIKFLTPSAKKLKVTGIIETKNITTVLSSLSLLTKHQFKLEGEVCTII
tara:strand:- start:447 stop:1340 length:894 start_codon:yes stop_codon:yes gene_type:complete